MSTKRLWKYTGPVYRNGVLIEKSASYETFATSFADAKNKIIFKIALKDANGVVDRARMHYKEYKLLDDAFQENPNPNEYPSPKETLTCIECGAQLLDSGLCPKCDLLDDRYDEE